MPHLSGHDVRQNRVTAVLEARVLSFDISSSTTLWELARRLRRFGQWHHEALLSVEITKGPRSRRHMPRAGRALIASAAALQG